MNQSSDIKKSDTEKLGDAIKAADRLQNDPVCALKELFNQDVDIARSSQVTGSGVLQLAIDHAEYLHQNSQKERGAKEQRLKQEIANTGKKLAERVRSDSQLNLTDRHNIENLNESKKLQSLKAELQNLVNTNPVRNNLEIIKFCLNDKEIKNFVDLQDGKSIRPIDQAINLSAKHGNTDILECLLESGADTKKSSKNGSNAFDQALKQGKNLGKIFTSLSRGAAQKFDTTANKSGAAREDCIKYVDNLRLNYERTLGVLCDFNQDGNNLLHQIIISGNTEALDWINNFLEKTNLDQEANNAVDKYNQSAKGFNDREPNSKKHKPILSQKDKNEIINNARSEQAKLKTFLEKKRDLLLNTVNGNGLDNLDLIVIHNVRDDDFISKLDIRDADSNQITASQQAIDVFKARHQNADGKITDPGILKQLVSNSTENDSLSRLITDEVIDHNDVIHLAIANEKTHLLIEGEEKRLKRQIKDLILNNAENHEGYTPLETTIINKNNAFADVIFKFTKDELTEVIKHKNPKTGENFFHLVVQNYPERIEKILNKLNPRSNDVTDLINAQNKQGKTPIQILLDNNQSDAAAKLTSFASAAQDFKNEKNSKLYNAAKSGNIDVLRELASNNPNIIYKTVNGESIIEIASDNNQGTAVKFLISEHKKLQEKLKAVNADIEITALPENQNKYTDQYRDDLKNQKTQLEARIKESQKQIQDVALKILPTKPEETWHQEVLDAAELQAQVIQNYLNERNPLYRAVESGNRALIEKLNTADHSLVDKNDAESRKSPLALAKEIGDIDALLIFGQDVDGAYNKRPSGKIIEKVTQEKQASDAVIDHELLAFKATITDPQTGKGNLTPYVNKLINDNAGGEKFKNALKSFDDKKGELIKDRSPDGHTILTLTASLGTISQWETLREKYKKIGRNSAIHAFDDATSQLGTPVQVAIMAKYCTSSAARSQLINHIFSQADKPDMNIRQDGKVVDTLLHTVARCSDIETLELINANYDYGLISEALYTKNRNGETPLGIAMKNGNINFLQHVFNNIQIEQESGELLKSMNGARILHTVAANHNSVLNKYILNLIFKLDEKEKLKNGGSTVFVEKRRDENGQTPFQVAVSSGNEELVEHFLNNEKHFTTETANQRIPQNEALIEWLADKKTKADSSMVIKVLSSEKIGDVKQEKLLEIALNSNDAKLLEFAFTKLEITRENLKEFNGRDPLYEICKRGNLEQLNYLLENGIVTTNYLKSEYLVPTPQLSSTEEKEGTRKTIGNLFKGIQFSKDKVEQEERPVQQSKTYADLILETPSAANLEFYRKAFTAALDNREDELNNQDELYQRKLQEFKDLRKASLGDKVAVVESTEDISTNIKDAGEEEIQKFRNSFGSKSYEVKHRRYQATLTKKQTDLKNIQDKLLAVINQDSSNINIQTFESAISQNPNILNSRINGSTLVDQVFLSGNANLVSTIVKYYDPNLTDNNGDTLIHRAAMHFPKNIALINQCINSGGSLSYKNKDGKTVENILAERRGDLSEIQYNNDSNLGQYLNDLRDRENKYKSTLESLKEELINKQDQSSQEKSLKQLCNSMKSDPRYYAKYPVLSEIINSCFQSTEESTRRDRFSILSKLMREGIQLDEVDHDGNNILHQLFSKLVYEDLDQQAKKHVNNIISGLVNNNTPQAKRLLLMRNNLGITPIALLAQVSNPGDILNTIGRKSHDLDIGNELNLSSLLQASVVTNNYNYCEWLLKNYNLNDGSAPNINTYNDDGDSALSLALQIPEDFENSDVATREVIVNGRKEIIDLLLANGADINALDKYGRNILQATLDKFYSGDPCSMELMAHLVERGASLTYSGETNQSNLSADDRLQQITENRNISRERYWELYCSPNISAKEYAELQELEKSKLEINLLEFIQGAQKQRETNELTLRRCIEKALFRPNGDSKTKQFVFEGASKLIEKLTFGKIQLERAAMSEKDHCSMIGGDLYLKTDKAIDSSKILAIDNVCKANLDLDGVKATIQKKLSSSGVECRNYIVRDGTLSLNIEGRGGKPSNFELEINDDGTIKIDNKVRNKILTNKESIDGISHLFINAKSLKETIKTGKWDAVKQREKSQPSISLDQENAEFQSTGIPINEHQLRRRASSIIGGSAANLHIEDAATTDTQPPRTPDADKQQARSRRNSVC